MATTKQSGSGPTSTGEGSNTGAHKSQENRGEKTIPCESPVLQAYLMLITEAGGVDDRAYVGERVAPLVGAFAAKLSFRLRVPICLLVDVCAVAFDTPPKTRPGMASLLDPCLLEAWQRTAKKAADSLAEDLREANREQREIDRFGGSPETPPHLLPAPYIPKVRTCWQGRFIPFPGARSEAARPTAARKEDAPAAPPSNDEAAQDEGQAQQSFTSDPFDELARALRNPFVHFFLVAPTCPDSPLGLFLARALSKYTPPVVRMLVDKRVAVVGPPGDDMRAWRFFEWPAWPLAEPKPEPKPEPKSEPKPEEKNDEKKEQEPKQDDERDKYAAEWKHPVHDLLPREFYVDVRDGRVVATLVAIPAPKGEGTTQSAAAEGRTESGSEGAAESSSAGTAEPEDTAKEADSAPGEACPSSEGAAESSSAGTAEPDNTVKEADSAPGKACPSQCPCESTILTQGRWACLGTPSCHRGLYLALTASPARPALLVHRELALDLDDRGVARVMACVNPLDHPPSWRANENPSSLETQLQYGALGLPLAWHIDVRQVQPQDVAPLLDPNLLGFLEWSGRRPSEWGGRVLWNELLPWLVDRGVLATATTMVRRVRHVLPHLVVTLKSQGSPQEPTGSSSQDRTIDTSRLPHVWGMPHWGAAWLAIDSGDPRSLWQVWAAQWRAAAGMPVSCSVQVDAASVNYYVDVRSSLPLTGSLATIARIQRKEELPTAQEMPAHPVHLQLGLHRADAAGALAAMMFAALEVAQAAHPGVVFTPAYTPIAGFGCAEGSDQADPRGGRPVPLNSLRQWLVPTTFLDAPVDFANAARNVPRYVWRRTSDEPQSASVILDPRRIFGEPQGEALCHATLGPWTTEALFEAALERLFTAGSALGCIPSRPTWWTRAEAQQFAEALSADVGAFIEAIRAMTDAYKRTPPERNPAAALALWWAWSILAEAYGEMTEAGKLLLDDCFTYARLIPTLGHWLEFLKQDETPMPPPHLFPPWAQPWAADALAIHKWAADAVRAFLDERQARALETGSPTAGVHRGDES